MATTRTQHYDIVAARHARYAAELHRRYAAKLSTGDCEDLVQNALLAAWSAGAAHGRSVGELESYVRTAARNAAISQLRAIHGQGGEQRSYTAFDDALHATATPEAPEEQLLASAEAAEHRAMLLAAFDRLPAVNKAALRDRYTLDLRVAVCAERRGLSRTKFERLFTASVNRLRALLADSRADACMRSRFELDVARDKKAPVDAAARALAAAHLDSSLSCKTYRLACPGGLLGALPLPAISQVHRLFGRLPGFGGQADRVAAAANTVEVATATGAGAATAGAGGAVLLGISAKTATIGVCSLLATGACVFGGQQLLADRPAKPTHAPVAKKDQPAPRPRPPALAAPPPVLSPTVANPNPAVVRPRTRASSPTPKRGASPTRAAPTQPVLPTAATRDVASPIPTPAPLSTPVATPTLPQRSASPPPSSAFSTEFAP